MNFMRSLPGLVLASIAAVGATLGAPRAALANGASYATPGTGTFTQSLAWLDFAGYNDATAANGGQAYSLPLPDFTTVVVSVPTPFGNVKL